MDQHSDTYVLQLISLTQEVDIRTWVPQVANRGSLLGDLVISYNFGI